MGQMSSLVLLALFVASAGVIWYAGVRLSDTTDVLSERLGLGSAMGGLILLAVVTNLPEAAITVSAALSHHLDVAVGNILGGIAVQTVVLAVLDGFGVGSRAPLTYVAASLTLVLEGALVVGLLALVVMGTQLPRDVALVRMSPASIVITLVWLVGLYLLKRAGQGLPWHEGGDAPDTKEEPRGSAPASPPPGSATTSWRSATSSAATPSFPCCSWWPSCCPAGRCSRRRTGPTST
jgi:cation:H+ antiporter